MTNTEILQRALACFADASRRDQYFDLYAPDVVLHGYEGVQPGLESVKNYYGGIWAAFPDARVEAEDIIETPDKLAVRFVMSGTHLGPLRRIAPTGRVISLRGITILRFAAGKCVERWSVTDSLSMLVQLGVLPAPGAP